MNRSKITAITAIIFATTLTLNAQFGGGNGTQTNPFQIRTKAHLEALADSVNNSPSNTYNSNWSRDRHFILMNDITDSVRTVIGKFEWEYAFQFQGKFNGNNKKITLAIHYQEDTTEQFYIGLFGGVANAEIYDLSVDGYVRGLGTRITCVGGIVGVSMPNSSINISNCINYADIESSRGAGGIAGYVMGEISNCINYGSVKGYGSGDISTGGIVGSDEGSNISHCTNYGNVKNYGRNGTGGIVGRKGSNSDGGNVSNCINYGDVEAIEMAGGIVGRSYASNNIINISHCFNYGGVSGVPGESTHFPGLWIGGIAGYIPSGCNISNCINYASIEGASGIGGIVGLLAGNVNRKGNVLDCFNYGSIEGASGIGGIVGYVNYTGNANISGCTNYSDIFGITHIGGVVGYCRADYSDRDVFVSYNVNYGNVKGDVAVGGITGCTNYPGNRTEYGITYISYCLNAGAIEGDDAVGGIAGDFHAYSEISHCINIGTAKGIYSVGGIAGGSSDSGVLVNVTKIYHSINSGLVIGEYNVGGIRGANLYDSFVIRSMEIISCINTGVVISTVSSNFQSGIADIDTSIIQNTYYDKQMCIYGGINNVDVVGQAEGRLTKEMIGTRLRDKLGDAEWVYSDNLYPTLKVLENHPIAMIARSPVYLDDENIADFDQQNNIKKCFPANIQNNIRWTKAFDIVNIVPKNNIYNEVYLAKLGNDTLYAGIYTDSVYIKKTLPIFIKALGDTCVPAPLLSYILTLKANPEGLATLTGAGEYEYNDSITITATTTDDCYYFKHWEDAAGNVISTDSEYTFPITSDSILIAVFEQYSYFVFINAMPTYMGSIEGGTDGYYPCGRVFNLEAIPQDTIYKFVYWSSSDSTDTLGIEDTLTLIAKSPDTMIIAHFDNAVGIEENDIYDISIVPNPAKNDFSIIFENPDAQTISIELLDISGRTILDIFSGFAPSGTQIYKVDSQLSSGTYLIKFVINNKPVIRKVIVR